MYGWMDGWKEGGGYANKMGYIYIYIYILTLLNIYWTRSSPTSSLSCLDKVILFYTDGPNQQDVGRGRVQ